MKSEYIVSVIMSMPTEASADHRVLLGCGVRLFEFVVQN